MYEETKDFEEFVAVTTAIKGLWSRFTADGLGALASEEVCVALEKAEALLQNAVGTPVFEAMCFSESTTHFFPLIAAMSMSPVPSEESQLTGLRVFKLLLAAASNASPSGAALLAKLFRSHRVVELIVMAIRTGSEADATIAEEVVTSVVETFFVGVATNTNIAQQVLSCQQLPEIVSFLRRCSQRGFHQAIYFLIALFRVLAVEGPREHAAMILISNNLHHELLDIVRSVGAHGAEAIATVVGLGLQVLAVLLDNCPSAFGEALQDPSLPPFIMALLASKWSETLCGACLWVKAILHFAPSTSPVVSGLIGSELHNSLLFLTGVSTIHVAAHAASALRVYILKGKPTVAGRKMLCSTRSLYPLLTVLLDETLFASDETQDRVVRSETALVLSLVLTASPTHRELLASKLKQHFNLTSLARLRESTLAAIDDYHVSIFAHWPLEEVLGKELCQQWSEAGCVPATAKEVFHQQEEVLSGGGPNVSRITYAGDSRTTSGIDNRNQTTASPLPVAVLFGSEAERGVFLRLIFRTAVEITFALSSSSLKQEAKSSGSTYTAGFEPSIAKFPSNSSDGCDKAVKLILQLSKYYGAASKSTFGAAQPQQQSERSASSLSSSSVDHSAAARYKNVWSPPKKNPQVQSQRRWNIQTLDKGDLFTFSIASQHWIEGLNEAKKQCTSHIMYLHGELQKCATSKIQRRALLTDLHEVVYPKVMICFKFLSALLARPDGIPTLQAVLSERGETTIDAGNLHDLYVALAS